jgi:iron complex transport system substrate-binding protein
LRAVREARVFVADGNHYFNRPGPRIVESLEILAEILHPELRYEDSDRCLCTNVG